MWTRGSSARSLSVENQMNLEADIVFAADIKRTLNISAATLNMWLRQGRIPQPDVKITQRTRYWLRSTLVTAGVMPPVPQESKKSE